VIRVGSGYDIHRLTPGRTLILGGVHVPSPVGEAAHSDGDVLDHAVTDALLGAVSAGDIGTHFPPDDPAYDSISSRVLLARALEIAGDAGYRVSNLDCTVVLEAPRLGPFIPSIRRSLARDLGVELERVSVKAKTKEGIGEIGAGRAVEAYATVLIETGLPEDNDIQD
jgi:2-C-methyl-D-erythritol 2,4-cyclodiphosphate synthase